MPDIIKWDRVWKDGWVQDRDRVAVVLCHDGGEVTEKLTLWFFDEVPGEAAPASWLAGELGIDTNTPLTAEELTALEDHFNDREYNGLLRFPYADASQAADYLSVLFYDLGEDESTLTEEEKAALEEAGVPLDLDVFRLKRDYVETYLQENLWLALSGLEPLADPPGTYLEDFDAWYQSHGDTAMQTYVFDSGTVAPDSRVVDSRTTDDGNSIRRRRECTVCGKRFTTYETVEKVPLMVIKNDGSRAVFAKEKILQGIIRSCYKRDIPTEKIIKLADDIEREICNTMKHEIPSKIIGEIVMKHLKTFDKVAYIRFASVYRKFSDIDNFKQELENLNSMNKDKLK